QDVSFFFRNGGALIGSGHNANMDFTAPSFSRYGEPPNMLIHAEPGSNTSIHLGNYSQGAQLRGVVYAPDGHFQLSGNTGGTWAHGQLIVGQFSAEGSSGGVIEFEEYV